ncbi:hypothetical protein [Mucilaginibacter aquatilis]|uniref:Uncharacterized protein n=1 Tax=Mucilaginibacter aquatilis TaxID=1517760 RepID=A0A6I4IA90_9SPHI|nr:hypothetical protein [Mucilaginibacter aquatilis]MVN92071.1 hypothetical protein [Mucilaginibacter aquatilis]
MRKTKLLLALAMVFAALSFSLSAKAQNMVPIYLTYQGTSSHFAQWEVYCHNNDIDEDYFLFAYDFTKVDQTYRCGTVPAGNYTVYIRRFHYTTDWRYDWYARGQSAYNQLWDNLNYFELLNDVYIGDLSDSPEEGLNITIQNSY